VHIGPVFGDQGLDAWSIESMFGEWVYYRVLQPTDGLMAVANGWTLDSTFRFASSGWGLISFSTGAWRYRLLVEMKSDGSLTFWDRDSLIYILPEAGYTYQSFSIEYSAADQVAALWVSGVGLVGTLHGSSYVSPPGVVFGNVQGGAHILWNEMTLTIIPEPLAVALATGLVVLLAAGALRYRRRRGCGGHLSKL